MKIADLLRDTVKEFDLPSGALFAHVHDQAANAGLSEKLLFESDRGVCLSQASRWFEACSGGHTSSWKAPGKVQDISWSFQA